MNKKEEPIRLVECEECGLELDPRILEEMAKHRGKHNWECPMCGGCRFN
ncbi:MAG: hypothetical protein N0C91_10155 [Candidatus Thiodiazotropha endolucinida]|nr:hypothetical protein [Candidatus Thiodiazotropha taylori]MCG8119135.1 hypothetical protein [Candidatus Thiodiazotropha taylori]MCW4288065.1 hypothetical protein [Candidatus Thiodiazotropha endolucinida]MCW4294821.1 hypothetical protein [Candidatus Thiodiazotropha endolucinida]